MMWPIVQLKTVIGNAGPDRGKAQGAVRTHCRALRLTVGVEKDPVWPWCWAES